MKIASLIVIVVFAVIIGKSLYEYFYKNNIYAFLILVAATIFLGLYAMFCGIKYF